MLVGPLFGLIARDPTQSRPASQGNVLESNEDGNALRGGYESVAQRVGRQVLNRARALTGSTRSGG